MSDSKKSDPTQPSIEFLDDEPIIDLVDEVPEGPADGALSDLEKNLLNLERSFGHGLEKPGEDLRTLSELPDLDDLNGFDFEEDSTEHPAPGTLPSRRSQKSPCPTARSRNWIGSWMRLRPPLPRTLHAMRAELTTTSLKLRNSTSSSWRPRKS